MGTAIVAYVIVGISLGIVMEFAGWLFRQAAWVISSLNW